MPTTFTVITRQIASFSEFHTKLLILPARKKRMIAKGSAVPSAFFTRKMLVRVFRQGSSMKPKKR